MRCRGSEDEQHGLGIYFVIPFLLGNILGFQDLDPSSSRVLRQQFVRDILQYGGGVLEMWKLQSLINRTGIKPSFLQCTTYSWTCVCQQSRSTVSLIESGVSEPDGSSTPLYHIQFWRPWQIRLQPGKTVTYQHLPQVLPVNPNLRDAQQIRQVAKLKVWYQEQARWKQLGYVLIFITNRNKLRIGEIPRYP